MKKQDEMAIQEPSYTLPGILVCLIGFACWKAIPYGLETESILIRILAMTAGLTFGGLLIGILFRSNKPKPH